MSLHRSPAQISNQCAQQSLPERRACRSLAPVPNNLFCALVQYFRRRAKSTKPRGGGGTLGPSPACSLARTSRHPPMPQQPCRSQPTCAPYPTRPCQNRQPAHSLWHFPNAVFAGPWQTLPCPSSDVTLGKAATLPLPPPGTCTLLCWQCMRAPNPGRRTTLNPPRRRKCAPGSATPRARPASQRLLDTQRAIQCKSVIQPPRSRITTRPEMPL